MGLGEAFPATAPDSSEGKQQLEAATTGIGAAFDGLAIALEALSPLLRAKDREDLSDKVSALGRLLSVNRNPPGGKRRPR